MAETKERIFQEALRAFSSRGYSSATMREIAQTVGIKASSLYNHYPSKDAILIDIYAFIRSLAPADSVVPDDLPVPRIVLTDLVVGSLEAYSDPLVEAAWAVISEEQYLDPRAADLILFLTQRYLASLTSVLRALSAKYGCTAPGGPDELASLLGYASRALHLEYGVFRRHGMPLEATRRRLEDLADTFTAFFPGVSGDGKVS